MPMMMTITTSTTRRLDEAEEVAGAGISMHLIVSNKLRGGSTKPRKIMN